MKPSPAASQLFAPPPRGVPLTHGWEGGPVLRSRGPQVYLGGYLRAAVWLAGAGPGHVIWKSSTKGRVVITYSALQRLRLCDNVGTILEPS